MKDGKKLILIADDESEIRDLLKLLLTGDGYIVLTVENGFFAGADDYIVKPFFNIELLMRVKAILRRSNPTPSQPQNSENKVALQDLMLDMDSQSVFKGNEIINLTYTEYKILELLLTHRKKIYSLDNIYQSIWETDAVTDSSIMVHIKNIRKKLGDNSRNPSYIKTAWGKGYYVD